MKKILVINNDYFVQKYTLDFATRIAVDEKATLFGLFVGKAKNNDDENNVFPLAGYFGDEDYSEETILQKKPDYEKTNMQLFTDSCSSVHVPYKIQTIHNDLLDSLVDHSAFAD